MLATPDLVFTGLPSGEVMALDAKTLEKKWEFNTGGGVSAPPMSFSVDGSSTSPSSSDREALGQVVHRINPELKRMQPGSVLYVFAL